MTTTIISYDDIIDELFRYYIETKMKKDVFYDGLVSSRESFERTLSNVYSYCSTESQIKFLILCFGSTICKDILNAENKINVNDKVGSNILSYFKELLNKYPNVRDLLLCPPGNTKKLFDLKTEDDFLQYTRPQCGPNSNAGKIYEFDRAVIAINKNGEIIKKALDDLNHHHHVTTWCIINNKSLIYPTEEKDRSAFWKMYSEAIKKGPAEIAEEGAEKGFVILHLEGDCIWGYMPSNMNLAQLYFLLIVLAPRKKFNIALRHDNCLFENTEKINYIDVDYCEKYCINLLFENVPKKHNAK